MRRLLPLAFVLVACTKPEPSVETTPTVPPMAQPPATAANLTPESMAKEMDVPFYPGAEAPDGLSSAPEKRDDGSTHYSLVLATQDSVDKVAKWYSEKMDLPTMAGMGGKNMIGKSAKGNDILLTIAPEAGRTLIRIKSIAYVKK